MTDRFNSDEEVPWAQGCFHDGFKARLYGFPISTNPNEGLASWARKSWNAGWADADMCAKTDPEWPGEKEILDQADHWQGLKLYLSRYTEAKELDGQLWVPLQGMLEAVDDWVAALEKKDA